MYLTVQTGALERPGIDQVHGNEKPLVSMPSDLSFAPRSQLEDGSIGSTDPGLRLDRSVSAGRGSKC